MNKYFILFIIAILLFSAAIGWNIKLRNNFSDESVAAVVSNNLSREINSLNKELGEISNIQWSSLHHPFYLIEKGKIVKWSKTFPVVDVQDCQGDFEWKLVQSSKYDMLLRKRSVGEQDFIGIIPLRTGYEVVNQYLATTWNRNVFAVDRIKILDTQSPEGALVIANGLNAFKIQVEKDAFIENKTSVVFASISLFFLTLIIFFSVRDLHIKKKYTYAFILLFISLAILRIVMVQYSFPSLWVHSRYFDPKYFASSSFNASAGDFMLNALIVTIACAYFFSVYSRTEFIKVSFQRNSPGRWIIAVAFVTVAFFSFLFPHLFIEAIFHDSAVRIDITSSANFDGIRIIALIAFVLGCLSSFFFTHSFLRISRSLLRKRRFFSCVLVSAVIFTFYFLFSELDYWPTLIIGSGYFLALLFSKYYHAVAQVSYRTFPYLLIALIAYSLQGAWGIRRFSEEKKVRDMFRSANNLISNDVLAEYLLSQSSQKISNDSYLLASVESPLLSRNLARQKIKQVYLSEYLDRYAVTISLYHADGSPADAESSLDFASSIETYQDDANKTNYEWIYQIRGGNTESLKRYLAIVPLRKNNSVRGYVVLDLSLTRIVPQQVYPELLFDNRFAQSIRNKDFSYALFNGDKVTDRNGNFNFDRDLDKTLLSDARLYSSGIDLNHHWIAGAEDEAGKKVILVADEYPWFRLLANFSFLFTLGVLLIFVFLIFYLIRHLLSKREINYSARIQLFVYLSFIFPLLTVSVIALRMISQSNESQNEKEIESKGASISESLANALDKKNSDSVSLASEMRGRILEISQTTGVDVNLYDANGELAASSQQRIFSNQLLMPLVDRNAWEKISNENYSTLKLQGRIGSLDYNSSFFAIRSESTDRLWGILELPFFSSTTDTLRTSVLANILVTFTIVFVLFSLLASNAIGKLTSPLRFIAKKLKATSLANNQPIEWKSNDEIGGMVKEYNRMLGNLEQSKIELSRSEKESAWREIAKQVAHEIKNPLTPMKLTLQQMERTLTQGELSKEKTENSVKTLLSQVETLNGIAGSFSAFATMPSPVITTVDLNAVLERSVLLFENHILGTVHLEKLSDPISVQADEKLLGRIFSNIILNGLQSNREKKVTVHVSIKTDQEWSVVRIADNGSGVAEELQDKIFLPHFSTKETGSGLGLAIAKQGIEQMGGGIWFETSNSGTSFFIKLKNT